VRFSPSGKNLLVYSDKTLRIYETLPLWKVEMDNAIAMAQEA
jgi:hypothetical protein